MTTEIKIGKYTWQPKEGYKTWENVCPLRFVMRDGKRILQSPHRCAETGEVKWQDVPMVEEQQP